MTIDAIEIEAELIERLPTRLLFAELQDCGRTIDRLASEFTPDSFENRLRLAEAAYSELGAVLAELRKRFPGGGETAEIHILDGGRGDLPVLRSRSPSKEPCR